MKKVKKFGRGGDILTGLGAGLMGYALYKKLKGEGEDKDDKRPAKKEPEVSITEPREKERSAEEKRALATSKGRPELIPEGTTVKALLRAQVRVSYVPLRNVWLKLQDKLKSVVSVKPRA